MIIENKICYNHLWKVIVRDLSPTHNHHKENLNSGNSGLKSDFLSSSSSISNISLGFEQLKKESEQKSNDS